MFTGPGMTWYGMAVLALAALAIPVFILLAVFRRYNTGLSSRIAYLAALFLDVAGLFLFLLRTQTATNGGLCYELPAFDLGGEHSVSWDLFHSRECMVLSQHAFDWGLALVLIGWVVSIITIRIVRRRNGNGRQ
jgi:hypothetical protein